MSHTAIFIVFVSVFLAYLCCIVSTTELSCKDENNNNVDWFIGLKYPKSYDFVYITPSNNGWISSKYNLSSPDNMVAVTLKQSYSPTYFYAYYNDEPVKPMSYDFEKGHLKGVLNFDQNSGYWLIHSVPKFPNPKVYKYGRSEMLYGQSFLCISVGIDTLSAIVGQLLMMESTVYNYSIPTDFTKNQALLAELNIFVKNRVVQTPTNISLKLSSNRQLQMIHFGKSRQFNKDLYWDLIAPSLKTSLYVETWIRGEKIPSSCSLLYKVFNVKSVNLPNKKFVEEEDHSKWAVSQSPDHPFVCIGDINRMTSQFKRGGGSMCVYNPAIWKLFQAVVADYEHCPN